MEDEDEWAADLVRERAWKDDGYRIPLSEVRKKIEGDHEHDWDCIKRRYPTAECEQLEGCG